MSDNGIPTVCLTFDVDSMSNWIGSVGWTEPGLLSRGEFDVVGLERILRLLARRQIRGTFCVPGFTAVAYPDLIRRVAAEGHEVAHHGWIHENPSTLDPAREREILRRAGAVLEDVAGRRPVGYRSPAWEYSARTIPLLVEEGFLYDSGQVARDFDPYYVRVGDVVSKTEPYVFGGIVDLVEMPVSWERDDWPFFECAPGINAGLAGPRHVLEIWKGEFDYMHTHCRDGVYVLTMHPQVIGRGHRMTMLEELLDHMQAAGARFSRMDEHALRWRADNPVDAWKAANPTLTGASVLPPA